MVRPAISEGGCLCGAVRYAVEGEPISSVICHCRTCRKSSAASSVAWVTFSRGRFRLLSGALRGYASSEGVDRSSCGTCGTPITYESGDLGDAIDITTVSLDDPLSFAPTREIWLEHRLGWVACNVALAQYPRSSNEPPPGVA